jgi:hypothetical protein
MEVGGGGVRGGEIDVVVFWVGSPCSSVVVNHHFGGRAASTRHLFLRCEDLELSIRNFSGYATMQWMHLLDHETQP